MSIAERGCCVLCGGPFALVMPRGEEPTDRDRLRPSRLLLPAPPEEPFAS
jgi:hypothetical protein